MALLLREGILADRYLSLPATPLLLLLVTRLNRPARPFPLCFRQQGTGFYFSFYDSARHAIAQNPDIPLPQFITTFGCGSAAGLASWTLIYPLDLVKAKVQRNALADLPYEKPWAIFRRLSDNGFTRLYRGLGVSAARSIFTHGLMCELCSSFASFCTSLTLRRSQGRFSSRSGAKSLAERATTSPKT